MSDTASSTGRIASHIVDLPRSGIRDFFELVRAVKGVISLGVGEPDFVTPMHIRQATIKALNDGETSYTSNLGMLELRQAVCDFLQRRESVSYDPVQECIITVGVSEALDLILRAMLNPGDEVIYHEPCYVSYAPSVIMAHARPVAVETREENGFAVDPKDIEAAITPRTRLILLNFPNNPTGATLSWEAKQEIARIAVKHDLVVITDEIYAQLNYGDFVPSLISCPGMRDRTIYLNGVSKAYAMTGYRIGYACGPADLIDSMMRVHQYSMLCASGFAQIAAVEALQNGDQSVNEMRDDYKKRRDVIVRRLNDMGLSCMLPKGAFYVFPNIKSTGMSSKDFSYGLIEAKKVAVVPGTAFGACGEGFVRCCYTASMENIEIAMERMAEFVAENRK